MNILFYLAVILMAGIFVAKILSKFKLPNVTGYLIAGLIIGPSILGIIPKESLNKFSIVSEVALAFIAYSIGSEFNLAHLKKMSKGIVLITFLQSLMAVLFITLTMVLIFKQPFFFSLIIGAIGSATAPAATLMVVKQYNAKGPLVDTLLPVVAMDDAVCIMAFGISTSIASTLINNAATVSMANLIILPLIEIVGALALGLLMGILLILISKRTKGESELLSSVIAIIFATTAISLKFNLSSLLACMMLGATLVNVTPNNKSVFTTVEKFTPPIYIAFFTIAGIELDFTILKSVGMIGIAYILSRVAGKVFGSYLGAKIANAPETIRKYLGYTLIPQAGVAIGLSLVAQRILPDPYGAQIRTIVLAATVIYELLGPMITKRALIKAGEIKTGY